MPVPEAQAGPKKEKKKYQSKASLEQEFHKRIADQMAAGIRQMAEEERIANEFIKKVEADGIAEVEERKRQKSLKKKKQLKITVEGDPQATDVPDRRPPSLRPAMACMGRLTAQAYCCSSRKRSAKTAQYERLPRAPGSFGVKIDLSSSPEKKAKKKGADVRAPHGLSMAAAYSKQLRDPYISDKKRREVGAKMIQRAANVWILEPWRRERAARVLQKNFRIYREHLLTRKFHIMMRLELKARRDREVKLEEMRAKKEKHKASAALEAKKKMERVAAASGNWNKKDMKNKSKGWSKRDMACLVALNYTHGLPRDNDDDAWDYSTDEFPKKKKSEISK